MLGASLGIQVARRPSSACQRAERPEVGKTNSIGLPATAPDRALAPRHGVRPPRAGRRNPRCPSYGADGALVAALTSFRITVWSTATGALVGAALALASVSTFGAFSPDAKRLATGMVDSTTLVWDVAKLPKE
ncbi:MAG: WD40 repeat domain-containing protein [Planctomycetes bacterium]|nr:WD40 repeat domain-containing protein [Planctomycetota bacterium]